MTDVLASEWWKIRSVRSTTVIVAAAAATVLLGALLAWNWAHYWDGLTADDRAGFAGSSVEQATLPFVHLCMAVLGVLTITSEYATGMIRTTLVAVPRRRTLLVAKALIVAGISLAAGQVVMFATYFLSRAVIGDRPFPAYQVPLAEKIGNLLSEGLSVAVVTVVAFGLGVVLRSAAGAITTIFAVLFILPTLTRVLPEPWDNRAYSVMLASLPDQIAGRRSSEGFHGVLPPWAALFIELSYVVLFCCAAMLTVVRRDAL